MLRRLLAPLEWLLRRPLLRPRCRVAVPDAGREPRKRSEFRTFERASTDADQARWVGNGNRARHSTGEGEGGTARFSERQSLRRRCPEVRRALHAEKVLRRRRLTG